MRIKIAETKSKKTAYSCYFEVQLEESDFGLSREQHNKICNDLLLEQIKLFESEGRQFYSKMSNNELIYAITSSMSNGPGKKSLTWEHCSTSSTAGGRMGVMRLVPTEQHTKAKDNPFWKTIHPDYHDRGGYHEWAIPAGAPAAGYQPISKKVNIKTLPAEQLPLYFKITVCANSYDQFKQVLNRAKKVCSPSQLQAIFTQDYIIGKKDKVTTTLLYIASKNGYLPMIEAIKSNCGVELQTQLNKQDKYGNTPAHIASDDNRHKVLQLYKDWGADLTIQNKRKRNS